MLSLDNLPNFYHTLLVYLQDLNSIITADDNVLEKIIWKQPEYSNQRKIYFFYSSWFNKDIISIRSLMTEYNQFLSLSELR